MAKSDNDYYNYLLSCGFDEQEAQQKMQEREILIYIKAKKSREKLQVKHTNRAKNG